MQQHATLSGLLFCTFAALCVSHPAGLELRCVTCKA
jgi:hypothetical protein